MRRYLVARLAQTLLVVFLSLTAVFGMVRLTGDPVLLFLWQQHDLYGVAQTVEWTPRADEKVWMYDAKVVAR